MNLLAKAELFSSKYMEPVSIQGFLAGTIKLDLAADFNIASKSLPLPGSLPGA